jgi:hypothetical protein
MSIDYSKLKKFDPYDFSHQTFDEFYVEYSREAKKIGVKAMSKEDVRAACATYKFKPDETNEFGPVCP